MTSLIDADFEAGFERRLARNLSVQALGQVAAIAISFFTLYVLSRSLDQVAFGGFSYLFTFIYFFLTFSDPGLSATLVREISQQPERTRELVQNLIGLRLAIAAVLVLIGWVASVLLGIPPAYRLSVQVFLLLLPIQALATPITVLQARLQIRRGAFIDLANRITGFSLMMIAAWRGQGLLVMTLCLLAGELAGLAVVISLTWRVVLPVPRVDLRHWRDMLRLGVPLAGNNVLVALLNQVDRLMLQRMAPSPEIGLVRVGFYNAAYRLPNLAERLPQLMMATVFPIMSKLAVTEVEQMERVYRRTIRNLAGLALPVALAVFFAAPLVIRVWFPPGYEPVVGLLRVLIWATAFLYICIPGGHLLIALKRPRINFWLMLPATAINIVLNLAWIPTYGALGAAWATVVGYGILCVSTLAAVEIVLADERRRSHAG